MTKQVNYFSALLAALVLTGITACDTDPSETSPEVIEPSTQSGEMMEGGTPPPMPGEGLPESGGMTPDTSTTTPEAGGTMEGSSVPDTSATEPPLTDTGMAETTPMAPTDTTVPE